MNSTNTETIANGPTGTKTPSLEKERLRALALAAQLRCHGLADRASLAAEGSPEGPREAVRYAVIAARAAVVAHRLAE